MGYCCLTQQTYQYSVVAVASQTKQSIPGLVGSDLLDQVASYRGSIKEAYWGQYLNFVTTHILPNL